MMKQIDQEALGFIKSLSEWLHQAGFNQSGSHLHFTYVAAGAQHVGTIQTQIVYGKDYSEAPPTPAPVSIDHNEQPQAPPTPATASDAHNQPPHHPQTTATAGDDAIGLPKELSTPKAMVLWQKARQERWVDERLQPLISRTQSALLAHEMARQLSIRYKWKTFETFWNRKNMYKDYYQALNQVQSLSFQDLLKQILK